MDKKPNIVRLKMTCSACPSQWEGVTDDGGDVYIRYRYGYLYIEIDGKKIFDADIGAPLDGVMTTDEMTVILSEVVEFSYGELG